MASWYLLVLTALLCGIKDINAATYTLAINGNSVVNANGIWRTQNTAFISLVCRINEISRTVTLQRIVGDEASDILDTQRVFSGETTKLTYNLTVADKQQRSNTYRCVEPTSLACPHYVQVTIYFGSGSGAGPTIPNCPPKATAVSSPTLRPSSNPVTSSSSGGTPGPKFAGLNPLIYTISAVILLGTLAIVAIVTCWIRARRSYNRRMFQATTNPQDYLDYISDNDFTPLTTNEFVASLQERPPTYHESEEIEGQMRPSEGDESGEGGEGGEGSGRGESGGERRRGSGQRSSGGSRQSIRSRPLPPVPPPPPPTANNPQQSHPSTTSGAPPVGGARGGASIVQIPPNVLSLSAPPSGRRGNRDDPSSDNTQSSNPPAATSEDAPVVNEDPMTVDVEAVLSGVDALFAANFGNWNEAQQEFQSNSSYNPQLSESAAVGPLIDFGDPDPSLVATSNSHSTFPSLSQPTAEQISEIEAAVGAATEHVTGIRERTE